MDTKIFKQIGFMALGAIVVRGVGGLAPATTNQNIVHGGLAFASAMAAMKFTEPNLQSALIGATLVKSLDLGKSVFEATTTAQTLATKTDKASAFLRSATGLGCPCDSGLGYADEDYYLNGSENVYVDENGNVVGLGYADDEEYYLNGSDEEEYYLNGSLEAEYGLQGGLEAEYGIV